MSTDRSKVFSVRMKLVTIAVTNILIKEARKQVPGLSRSRFLRNLVIEEWKRRGKPEENVFDPKVNTWTQFLKL